MIGSGVGDIRGVLIPIGGNKLLLPNANVAEIIAFREPASAPQDAPDWLLGEFDWRQRRVPLAALENLLGGTYQGYTRGRIAICYSLLAGDRSPYLGLVSDGIPHLVRVREEDVEPLSLQPDDQDRPVLARLRFKDEEVVIPDVAKLAEISLG